jgi:membrane fusion protein
MDGGQGREQVDDTPEAAADLPLFRPEVLREQQGQWMGSVLLRPRPLHRWYAVFAALVVITLVSALALGSYTRKAHVPGWLLPAQGLVRVFAPRAGVASSLAVREGEQVASGQVLVTLSTDQQSAAYGATGEREAHALQAQRESLQAEGERNGQLLRQQRANIGERLAAMDGEQKNIQQEIELQKGKLVLAQEWEGKLRELQLRGFISQQQLRVSAEEALDQAARVRALERNLITLARDRAALEGELHDLPIKIGAQDALLARSVADNTRELAQVAAQRELQVTAPAAGTVTAIHANAGTAVSPGMPLLSIVPSGATLEAYLYAPSRSIGFVHAGQTVLLRYRAYPYQKFGHYRGLIKSVSRTAIDPAELPSMFAAGAAGAPAEPLYRITVGLERQQVSAYGAQVALQPGMQLDADIVLERRRLYEWVLDPVYALAGSWKQ